MYEIFERLLEEHGVTAYKVCKATGLTTATISNWKAGLVHSKARASHRKLLIILVSALNI